MHTLRGFKRATGGSAKVGTILNRVASVGFIEKVIFKQSLAGGEGGAN